MKERTKFWSLSHFKMVLDLNFSLFSNVVLLIEWTSPTFRSWFFHKCNALSTNASKNLTSSRILCCLKLPNTVSVQIIFNFTNGVLYFFHLFLCLDERHPHHCQGPRTVVSQLERANARGVSHRPKAPFAIPGDDVRYNYKIYSYQIYTWLYYCDHCHCFIRTEPGLAGGRGFVEPLLEKLFVAGSTRGRPVPIRRRHGQRRHLYGMKRLMWYEGLPLPYDKVLIPIDGWVYLF